MNTTKMYGRMLIMFVAAFVIVYTLLSAGINGTANIVFNLNQLYMAALITGAVISLQMLVMGSLYPKQVANYTVLAAGLLMACAAFGLIRGQVLVNDVQLLKSMIPHHAEAIHMCSKGGIADAQISELCSNIRSGQQAEIDWMRQKLERFEEADALEAAPL